MLNDGNAFCFVSHQLSDGSEAASPKKKYRKDKRMQFVPTMCTVTSHDIAWHFVIDIVHVNKPSLADAVVGGCCRYV